MDEFTLAEDGKNNLKNIGRTVEDKITNWKNSLEKDLRKDPLKELRWVTLGRHHNWLETIPGDLMNAGKIPEILSQLGEVIGQLLEFENPFKTEASIINYYPANTSSIGIHRDDLGISDTEHLVTLINIQLILSSIYIILYTSVHMFHTGPYRTQNSIF